MPNLDFAEIEKGQRYMQLMDVWFDKLMTARDHETPEEHKMRVRNGVKSKLVESYKNGRSSVQNPSPCPVCGKPRQIQVLCLDHE